MPAKFPWAICLLFTDLTYAMMDPLILYEAQGVNELKDDELSLKSDKIPEGNQVPLVRPKSLETTRKRNACSQCQIYGKMFHAAAQPNLPLEDSPRRTNLY